MRDSELLDVWRHGDAAAGQRLFRRHFAAVARFFRNKLSAGGELEDLIQQTFLGALEGRDRFRGSGSFRGYLFGIAYRVLGTHLRRKYRIRGAIALDEVSLHDLDPGPSLLVARRRDHQLLLVALRQLPIAYQVVLELYFWEDMTAASIAAALDIPMGTAQTRLRRARERLSRCFGELARGSGIAGDDADFDAWARAIREEAVEATP